MRRVLPALLGVVCLSAQAAVDTCNPLALNSCNLPFPSDHFTVLDQTSNTGLKLSMPNGLMLSQQTLDSGELPDSVLPESLFQNADGFSPAAPIMFELDRLLSADQLVNLGQDGIKVFDLDSYQQIDVHVGIKSLNRKQSQKTSQFIEVYPVSRFDFGHRIVAVLTQDLIAQSTPITVAPGVQQLLLAYEQGQASESDTQAIEFITTQGIKLQNIVSMTQFTIASEANVTQPMLELGEQVMAQRGRIRNLKVSYANIGSVAAKIRGEVLLNEYRDPEGKVDFSGEYKRDNWAKFELLLPKEANDRKVPLMIYGHGLGVPRETRFIASEPNLRKGIAVLSISHPNHGDRSATDGGFIFSILQTEKFPRILGMAHQSPLDFLATWHAAKTIIAANDWMPQKRDLSSRLKYNGIDVADIDPEKIYYMGTSLGGVFGSTFVATAPDLKGAWLQVAGVGVSNILMHSALFYGVGFANVIPDSASESDLAWLQSYIQMALDPGDGINFVHRLQTLPDNMQARPLAVQVGLGDSLVFNRSSHALALLTGISQVGEIFESWAGVPYLSEMDNGSGLLQVPSPLKGLPLEDAVAHTSFFHPVARRGFKQWQREVILTKN